MLIATPVNDHAPLLEGHRYLNAAILAAIERDDAEPAQVKPVSMDLETEDHTGELRWYILVDVQYNAAGHRALYGFAIGTGTDDDHTPALWQD